MQAVKKIQQKTETNPLLVLRQAIHGVTPNIGFKTADVNEFISTLLRGMACHSYIRIRIGLLEGSSWHSRSKERYYPELKTTAILKSLK